MFRSLYIHCLVLRDSSLLIIQLLSDSHNLRYLAVDIGGTNLRVGFVELAGRHPAETSNGKPKGRGPESRVVHTQRIWPIGEKLKNEKAEDLFAWIGSCIASVVEENLDPPLPLLDGELPMGVTFSFPIMYPSPPMLHPAPKLTPLPAKRASPKQSSCPWAKVLP